MPRTEPRTTPPALAPANDASILGRLEDERLCLLYRYWAQRCAGGRLPGRGVVDPVELDRAVLPHTMLIDVVRSPGASGWRLRYRLSGTTVEQQFGTSMTGRFVDEMMHGAYRAYIEALYRDVIERRAAVYSESAYRQASARSFVKRLMLPLAEDGRTVDMVLAGQIFSVAKDRLLAPVAELQDAFEDLLRLIEPAGG